MINEYKKQAEEIISEFKKHTLDCPNSFEHAKKCAVFLINKIIYSQPTYPHDNEYFENTSDLVDLSIEYWQKVLEEVKNYNNDNN